MRGFTAALRSLNAPTVRVSAKSVRPKARRRSLYQGLTFTLNKRFSNRFQFQVNYLLSFDKSDDDNERDPFTFRYADPRDLTPEYNWSDRDQRHRFNAFATFILPYDINISPIVQYRSAQPTSVTNRGTFPEYRQTQHAAARQRIFHVRCARFESVQVHGKDLARSDLRSVQSLQQPQPAHACRVR